jgi:toxin ParE1/3/4
LIQRARVLLRESALDDLRKISEQIVRATGSKGVAHGIATRIQERCKRIGDVPRGGRQRDDLGAGLRTVPFEHSAVICYVIDNDTVQITNIFYGGQDFEAILRERETRRNSSAERQSR